MVSKNRRLARKIARGLFTLGADGSRADHLWHMRGGADAPGQPKPVGYQGGWAEAPMADYIERILNGTMRAYEREALSAKKKGRAK